MDEHLDRLSAALAPRYRVGREVGRGGMAVVYAAHDLKHDRSVALKVLHGEVAAALGAERFLRETSLIAHLQHPHIVPLLDSGQVDGRPYYTMPLVTGESLRALLDRERQLPVDDVLTMAGDVASALEYAHAQGVVHRDIKPENILLSAGRAVVADFGIALALSSAPASRLTESGLIVGTPAYMSPEQASGDKHIDGRSDLYSLACVVYEAFAGHPPFAGALPRELLARHATDPVPSLHAARPDLPREIERALRRALAKSPADRQRSPVQFVRELQGVVTTSGQRALGDLMPRSARWIAAGLMVATAAAVPVLLSTTAEAFEARDWLVIADIDNRTGEPVFDDALTSALAISLEQSRYANVLPRSSINNVLRTMQRADTTRLLPAVALELARRAGARVVVLPTLEREGSGFALTLRAEATASQKSLAVRRGNAPRREAILATIDRLAADLRRDLGERWAEAEAPLPLESATTSSLEALRVWSEGQRSFRLGRYDAAITAYREAIAIDSNFAMAHKSLGATYYWINNRVSGDQHFERALGLRDRLTDRERLLVEADVASWRNRGDAAVRGYQRVLDRYPDDRNARRAMAFALLRARRLAEAATAYVPLVEADTTDFGARINLATALAGLGKIRESLPHYAKAFALRPDEINGSLVAEYSAAFAEAGFADSARLILERLAGSDVLARGLRARALGIVAVGEGMADSALQHFRSAVSLSRESANPTTLLRNRMLVVRTLQWMGRQAAVRAEFDSVVRTLENPRIEPAWIAIAYELSASAGNARAGEAAYRMLERRIDRGNANDLTDLQQVRSEQALLRGDTTTAIREAQESLTRVQEARSYQLLGRALERSGRLREARDRFVQGAMLPRGAGEGIFVQLEALATAGRLSWQLGDSAEASRHYRRLHQAWLRADDGFLLKHHLDSVRRVLRLR